MFLRNFQVYYDIIKKNQRPGGIIIRILIIEDEKDLSLVLSETLRLEGYHTDSAFTGPDGLEYALSGVYDVIILDIMLPGMDGIEVLRNMRKQGISSAVLLLTARSQTEDKVSGLDSGADDYLTKPFVTKELLARIRALSRRKPMDYVSGCLRFADICVNQSDHELIGENQHVMLSNKEYEMLEMLIENKGRLISKEHFIAKIWGLDSDVGYNSIEVYISFIRKKLDAVHSAVRIVTSRGLGYALKEFHDGESD